jgi:hypothetical protein
MTKQTTPFGVFRVGCGRQTVMHLPSRRLVDAQPEAQHPKSSAIHKLAGRLPHLLPQQPTFACNAISVAMSQELTWRAQIAPGHLRIGGV